jgi:hypothetical protein
VTPDKGHAPCQVGVLAPAQAAQALAMQEAIGPALEEFGYRLDSQRLAATS